MNNKFILLVGESGSGKTTVAQELYKRYGLSQVESYTTRLKREKNETGHTFVTESQFTALNNLVAYTYYSGNHYGATKQQVEENDIYVIDLKGVEYFFETYTGNKEVICVYISVAEDERKKRLIERDGEKEANKRISIDRVDFKNAEFIADVTVQNENIDLCVREIYGLLNEY